MNRLTRQILTVLSALTMVGLAGYVQSGMSGPTIGAISDRYPTYVVPAGYAFSIWGLLFGLSLAYAGWQALPSLRNSIFLRRIGWPAVLVFLMTGLWMPVFQAGFFAGSVVVMLILLATLIWINRSLTLYRVTMTTGEFWLVNATMGLFLGWVSVATIANIAQALVAARWDGWGIGPAVWGAIMMLVAGVIGSWVTLRERAGLFAAASFLWALVAVVVNRVVGPPATRSYLVAFTATIAVLIILLSAAMRKK